MKKILFFMFLTGFAVNGFAQQNYIQVQPIPYDTTVVSPGGILPKGFFWNKDIDGKIHLMHDATPTDDQIANIFAIGERYFIVRFKIKYM